MRPRLQAPRPRMNQPQVRGRGGPMRPPGPRPLLPLPPDSDEYPPPGNDHQCVC